MQKKHRIKPDVIVIAAIVLLALLLLLFSFVFKKEGSFAVVEINGKETASYPLHENGTFVLNGGTNTLVIKDGKAYLVNCDCPDLTCENTGKISYVGQTIVCLPNKLSVTVRGSFDGGVDLIS